MLHIKKNIMMLIVAVICFGSLGDLSAGASKTAKKKATTTPSKPSTTSTTKAKEEEEAKRLAEQEAQEKAEKAEAAEKKRLEEQEIVRVAADDKVETYSKYLSSLYDSVKSADNSAGPEIKEMEEKMRAKNKALKDEAEAYVQDQKLPEKDRKLPKPLKDPKSDSDLNKALVEGVTALFKRKIKNGEKALPKTDASHYVEKKAMYDAFVEYMKKGQEIEEKAMGAGGRGGRGSRS